MDKNLIEKINEFVRLEKDIEQNEKLISSYNEELTEDEVLIFLETEEKKDRVQTLVNELGGHLRKIENKVLKLNDGSKLVFFKDEENLFKGNEKFVRREYQAFSEGESRYYLLFKDEKGPPSNSEGSLAEAV